MLRFQPYLDEPAGSVKKCLWSEVSNHEFDARDGRKSCTPVAHLGNTLSTTRMDQIPEIFGQPRLDGGVWLDDGKIRSDLDVFVKDPRF